MPLVRVDLLEGKTPEYRAQIGQVVYQAMLDVLNVPKDDRFQIIAEHPQSDLQFDRDYLGIHRSDDCVFLQITLNIGRTVEMKQRFYKAVADGLHAALKTAPRRCLHQSGRSGEGKLVVRQWRSPVRISHALDFRRS